MKNLIPLFSGKREAVNAEDFNKALAADVLARTVWGEARGEGEAGMIAVACVILNRVAIAKTHGGTYWWGTTIVEVCQKPYQFSCWNKDDPNYRKLLSIDGTDRSFANAQYIAMQALSGKLPDPTGGATHYHTKFVTPHWAQAEQPTATIGQHIFYKLEG